MYTVTTTVPFDMVLDIDLGLWKLIQSQYPNYNFFHKSIIEERDMNFMKYAITARNEINPLCLFLKNDYISSADSLYNEFMENHYDDILKLSVNTAIFNMIRRSRYINDVLRFDIICNKQSQKTELEKRFKKFDIKPTTIMIDDLKKLDISSYGSIYIKNIQDIFNYQKFEGKNVIIGNYRFNFEKGTDIPLKESASQILLENPIQIIDVHCVNEKILPVVG